MSEENMTQNLDNSYAKKHSIEKMPTNMDLRHLENDELVLPSRQVTPQIVKKSSVEAFKKLQEDHEKLIEKFTKPKSLL